MRHLTPEQAEQVGWYCDKDGFVEYVDDVVDYLRTAVDYPLDREKPSRLRKMISRGRKDLPDARFMGTSLLAGIPPNELIEDWDPDKVTDINRELHNAIHVFVNQYKIQPSKTISGDLTRLVRLILEAASLLDDPERKSEIPRNIVRAALRK